MKYGTEVSITTVGRVMSLLGLTCQKPLRKAYEQNPSLVKKWQKKEFPNIKKLAKREGAQIYLAMSLVCGQIIIAGRLGLLKGGLRW